MAFKVTIAFVILTILCGCEYTISLPLEDGFEYNIKPPINENPEFYNLGLSKEVDSLYTVGRSGQIPDELCFANITNKRACIAECLPVLGYKWALYYTKARTCCCQ